MHTENDLLSAIVWEEAFQALLDMLVLWMRLFWHGVVERERGYELTWAKPPLWLFTNSNLTLAVLAHYSLQSLTSRLTGVSLSLCNVLQPRMQSNERSHENILSHFIFCIYILLYYCFPPLSGGHSPTQLIDDQSVQPHSKHPWGACTSTLHLMWVCDIREIVGVNSYEGNCTLSQWCRACGDWANAFFSAVSIRLQTIRPLQRSGL